MKHYRTFLAVVALTLATFVPKDNAAQSITELDRSVKAVAANSDMRHSSLAVSVYRVADKKQVYAYNPQQSLIPASMQKVFTTAVAYEVLGRDFRFITTLAYDGTVDAYGVLNGNLDIIGGGDPLLGSYRYRQTVADSVFDAWHKALLRNGIRQIKGTLYYNQSVFDNKNVHDNWQWGDMGNYYGAGVCGLNFHENMYFAYFNAGNKIGQPTSIDHITPNITVLRNVNEVVTAQENSGDQVVIYGEPNGILRTYSGTVPRGAKNFAVRGAMPNPASTCANMFAEYLRKNGITVAPLTKEIATVPKNVHSLLDYYSNTYNILAQYINRTSNNIYAESVFKFLGYRRYSKGTFANGAQVCYDFFRRNGLQTDGIVVDDGSGLSRCNLVTSDFTCNLLNRVAAMPIYKDFLTTLSEVGVNGTARNILSGKMPEGVKMYVKSGTMKGVKSFCGYCINKKGDTYSFCIICNNFNCKSDVAVKNLEQILYHIASMK